MVIFGIFEIYLVQQYTPNMATISIINGANVGIKAVLHVVNKFGAGQNNVAHLCI